MIHEKSNSRNIYIPDGVSPAEATARSSHLAIGAHQDDLEFMAFHGISACYGQIDHWFGGIICTDGAGSARSGKYAAYSDEAMMALRAEEQKTAARIGKYSFVAQLGHPSSTVKDPLTRGPLIDELEELLQKTQPEIVYAHNPADRHHTHVAVCVATIEAIRRLPPYARPKAVYGCEVWRDLDWLAPEDKVALDVSDHSELAERLNACFDSQIAGGKNYGAAVIGRRIANATFADSHQVDTVEKLWLAMDLTPLILDDTMELKPFVAAKINRFLSSTLELL